MRSTTPLKKIASVTTNLLICVLFCIDKNLEVVRSLKEIYIQFNAHNDGNPLATSNKIEDLIHQYYLGDYEIFRKFASF